MPQNSRGGGYDLARDKEAEGKKKKAFSSESRNQVGAQASPNMIGENPQAPTSVGELMTPSTFGREGPPVDEADLNNRIQRNQSFLSSPETKAALTQFGISMLAGANPGHAMYQALTTGERMTAAQSKLDQQALENQLAIERVQMDRTRLGIQTTEFAQEQEQKAARKEMFGTLKSMSDDELLNLAAERASEGDDEGAGLALRMMKVANPDASGLLGQYQLYLDQGGKGDLVTFKKLFDSTSTLETIRGKIATGGMAILTPGERQVYNDAISSDLMTSILKSSHPEWFGADGTFTGPGGAAVAPASALPDGLTEADVSYYITTYGKTREEIISDYNAQKKTGQ